MYYAFIRGALVSGLISIGLLLSACNPGNRQADAAETVDSTPAVAPPPAQPVVPVASAKSIDLGNGMALPLGEPLDRFKQDHQDFECNEFNIGVWCSTRSPAPSDCPGIVACTESTFTFAKGALDGFLAQYDEPDWTSLLRVMSATFGDGRVVQVSTGPMTSNRWIWELPQGEFILIEFTGTDVYGHSIAHPYSAMFTIARHELRTPAQTPPSAPQTGESGAMERQSIEGPGPKPKSDQQWFLMPASSSRHTCYPSQNEPEAAFAAAKARDTSMVMSRDGPKMVEMYSTSDPMGFSLMIRGKDSCDELAWIRDHPGASLAADPWRHEASTTPP